RSWLERRHVNSAIHARHFFGIQLLFSIHYGNQHSATGQLQSRADRFTQTVVDAGLDEKAINDRFNRWLAPLVEAYVFVERTQLAIDARANEAVARKFCQFLFELAFAPTDNWRQHHHALPFRQFEYVVKDLIDALAGNRRAASRAVRQAD